jgi:hypothetical protein
MEKKKDQDEFKWKNKDEGKKKPKLDEKKKRYEALRKIVEENKKKVEK